MHWRRGAPTGLKVLSERPAAMVAPARPMLAVALEAVEVVGAAAPYAFDGKIIRLTHQDFSKWTKVYHAIPDLPSELEVADAYYADQPPLRNWYFSVSRWLNREHTKLLKQAKEERDDRNLIY